MKSVMHTVLVIGDNREEKIRKYDADTEVEPYVKYKYKLATTYHTTKLKFLEALLNSNAVKITETQRELYKNMYLEYKDMTDKEFYASVLGEEGEFDEETNDILSTENPDGKYLYPKCYDEQLRKTGEEATFSTPFKLKNSLKAYVARKGDIDWDKVHMGNAPLYEAAWELCVEGREPKNDMEDTIKINMQNRASYFANFDNKEDYVRHSCSFWCYGVIDNDGHYHGLDYTIRDKDWVAQFYDTYIKDLPDDTPLAIYEVRNVD